jgi:hypothetical protein
MSIHAAAQKRGKHCLAAFERNGPLCRTPSQQHRDFSKTFPAFVLVHVDFYENRLINAGNQ